MTDQELRIKITTVAELRALRDLERNLVGQITAAKAAGRGYDELGRQLAGVQQRISGMGGLQRAKAEFLGLAESVPVLGQAMRALNGAAGAASIALVAGAAAVKAAAIGLKEYGQAQEAIFANDAALAQTGQLTDEYRERLQELAGQLQETTAIADEEWMGVLTRLTQFGARPENIEQYAEAVKNLAGLMGGDIQGAAQAFSRAMQGNFAMLSRYGIRVDEAGTNTEKLNKVMEELAQRGGGQLEARAQSLNGSWKKLKNATSDVWEDLGRLIVVCTPLVAILETTAKAVSFTAMLFGGATPKLKGLENAAVATTQSLDDLGEAGQKAGDKVAAAAEAMEKKYQAAADAIDKARAAQDALADAETARKLAKVELEEAQAKARGPLTPVQEAGFREEKARIRAMGEQATARHALVKAQQDKELADQRAAEEAKKVTDAQATAQLSGAGVKLAAQGAGLTEQQVRMTGGEMGKGFDHQIAVFASQIKDLKSDRQWLVETSKQYPASPGMRYPMTASEGERKMLSDPKKYVAEFDAQIKRVESNIELYRRLAEALAEEWKAKEAVIAAQKDFASQKPKLEAAQRDAQEAERIATLKMATADDKAWAVGFTASAEKRDALKKQAEDFQKGMEALKGGKPEDLRKNVGEQLDRIIGGLGSGGNWTALRRDFETVMGTAKAGGIPADELAALRAGFSQRWNAGTGRPAPGTTVPPAPPAVPRIPNFGPQPSADPGTSQGASQASLPNLAQPAASVDRSTQIINQGLEKLGNTVAQGWASVAATIVTLNRRVVTLEEQTRNSRNR